MIKNKRTFRGCLSQRRFSLKNGDKNIKKMELMTPGQCQKCPSIQLIPELEKSHVLQEVFNSYKNGISPSKFVNEMLMTTEQRIEALIKLHKKRNAHALKQVRNIEVIPHQIIFQNYKASHVYNVMLTVRNYSKNSCPLRVLFKSSPYFLLRYHTTELPMKIAPGMDMHFNLQFTPEENKDYHHQITFISCEEKYIIPIAGLGPRPLLDIPDLITLPDSIVNIGADTQILVKNSGETPAVFKITYQQPFFVNPDCGILEPNSTMFLQIGYKVQKEGIYDDFIKIHYETGETLVVKVSGRAKEGTIFLDKNSLAFNDTYMGLKSEKNLKIHNNTNHTVNFEWKYNATKELDLIEINQIKNKEMNFKCGCGDCDCSRIDININPLDDLKNNVNLFCKRIYNDESILKDNDKLLFSSEHFLIYPLEGEIKPGCSTIITVIFNPVEVQSYSATAYCDVTGKSERMPLSFSGRAIGPKVELNLESIDLLDVYMHTSHCFEVCIYNSGNVPALVMFLKHESEFGNQITINGRKTVFLEPFQYGAFKLEFRCTRPGRFFDVIQFRIEESKEIINFSVTGNAMNPVLYFEEDLIEFGNVSLGYPTIKSVKIRNRTPIEMPYRVFMKNDGNKPAITCEEYFQKDMPEIPENPKEYSLKPVKGTIEGLSTITVMITLNANLERFKELEMVVEVFDSDKCRSSIKITHNGTIPTVICAPDDIHIRFCFVHYSANRVLRLKNTTQLPIQFLLVSDQKPSINFLVDCTDVSLPPFGKKKLSSEIILYETGPQEANLNLMAFGGKTIHLCKVTSVGEGPVVSIQPEILNFGSVKLLEWHTKSITILNDSPINAELDITSNRTSTSPSNFPIKVDPSQAILEMEETRSFDVSIYLNDNRNYKQIITIEVKNRHPIYCTILARGIGTSIYVDPKFEPLIDFGPILTHTVVKKTFLFSNKGLRHHKILIAHQKNIKNFKNFVDDTTSDFQVEPSSFALRPLDEIAVDLIAQKNIPALVKDELFVHAVIENVEKRQIIMSAVVLAEFVNPVLIFSKKSLHFRTDYGVEKMATYVRETLEYTNKSKLPLQVRVKISPPFYLLIDQKLQNYHEIITDNEASETLEVYFNTDSPEGRSFTATGFIEFTYSDHPQIDKIPLKGEINYPNIRFQPDIVDFGCLPLGCHTHVNVELQNISPLTVWYKFEWAEISQIIYLKQLEDEHTTPKPIPSVTSTKTSGYSESEILFLHLEEETTLEIPKGKKGKKGKKGSSKNLSPKSPKGKDSPESSKGKKSPKSPKKRLPKQLPVEIIWEHYCVLEDPREEQILITLLYVDPIEMWDLIHEPPINQERQINLKKIFYSVLLPFYEMDRCLSVGDALPTEPSRLDDISNVIGLVPYTGCLMPYESQIINFGFRRAKEMQVKARALCRVLGGPTEYIDIVGVSSDLHYTLSKTYIDFHRQVFCEVCQKNIKLTNTGHISFFFDTNTRSQNETKQSEDLLESGWLTIQPKNGILEPNTSIHLMVRYFPGLAGKFLETFQLEIGYLKPVTITVAGYGVFPQIFLSAPRPSIAELPIFFCYESIASITPDFLEYVEDVKVWCHADNPTFEHDIPKDERKELKKNGWVIIETKMHYPSVMDIDLAMERMLLCKHIQENPTVLLDHSSFRKTNYIPNFYVPPYEVDFGYVLPETLVHYSITALNYGPTDANVRLIQNLKKSGFTDAGFNIQFPAKVITAGETFPIHILFYGSADRYPEKKSYLDYTILLEVAHGPRIPIAVKAVVTYPYFETSTKFLDFGQVLCGQCKMINFFLKNSGFVACTWTARLKIVLKRKLKYKEKPPKEPSQFYLRSTSGHLEPGEVFSFDVFFEPQKSGDCEWLVLFQIDNNKDEIEVRLKAEGVFPELKIQEENLEFDTALPYSETSTKIFTIENPCEFPIEFYFPDFDDQIKQEERLLNVLCHYYKSDDLYIPPRFPGQPLPRALFKFYEDLANEVKLELVRREMEMHKDDSLTTKDKKKRKSSKTSRLSSPSTVASKKFRSGKATSPKSRQRSAILLDEKLELALVLELLDNLMSLQENYEMLTNVKDPIKSAFLESKPSYLDLTKSSNAQEGIAIIFFGAPFTDPVHAANKLGMKTGLPVLSIDELIIQAMNSEGFSIDDPDAAQKIFQILEAEYKRMFHAELTPEIVEEEAQMSKVKLVQKIMAKLIEGPTLTNRSKKSGKSKKSAKSSKTSKSSKSTKRPKVLDTYLNIPRELFEEVLKQQLVDYKNGFVIDTLKSLFIPKPTIAADILLKVIGNTRYIHGIVLYNSLPYYDMLKERQMYDERQKGEAARRAKLAWFDEMSEDEFKNLTDEDLALYKDVYIPLRKAETEKRLKELARGKQKSRKKHTKRGRRSLTLSSRTSKRAKESKMTLEKSKEDYSKKSPGNTARKSIDKKKERRNTEDELLAQDFNLFDSYYFELLHMFEYWDRENSELTKVYVPKVLKQPKAKKGKKGSGGKKLKKESTSARGSKASRGSGRSKRSIRSTKESFLPMVITDNSPIGVPYWVIMDIYQEESVLSTAADMISVFKEFQDAKKSLNNFYNPEPQLTNEVFSVVHKPPEERVKSSSDVFVIGVPLPPRTSTDSASPSLMQKSTSVTFKRKERQRKLSTKGSPRSAHSAKSNLSARSKKSQTSKASLVVEAPKFKGRYVLQPYESEKFQVQFLPKKMGTYEFKYDIEIVGCSTKYSINCQAICDIPRIEMDPIIMFPNVVSTMTKKLTFEPNLYLIDRDVFNFGHIIVKPSIERSGADIAFQMKNVSKIEGELSFHLDNQEVYSLRPETINIKPSERQFVTVTAKPKTLGVHSGKFKIIMKENPVVNVVNVECTGSELEFDISPKKINFERVLLKNYLQKQLILSNLSPVPLNWKFINPEALQQYFYIATTSGIIKPCQNEKVTIEYMAEKVEEVPKQMLEIHVFDDYCKEEPLMIDFVEIQAETCELLIDCDPHIIFGDLKARNTYTYKLEFCNNGKHPLFLEIENVNRNGLSKKDCKVLDMFQINQLVSDLQLIPKKTANIFISFNPKKELKLKDFPIYKCTIFDIIQKDKVVLQEFNVTVDASTYFSRFEIKPPTDIFFGPIAVAQPVTQTLLIKNVGKFPFNFNIMSKAALDALQAKLTSGKGKGKSGTKSGKGSKKTKSDKKSEKSKTTAKSGKSSKKSKGSKGSKKGKQKIPPPPSIKYGCFTVKNYLGTIEPGSSKEVTIDCLLPNLQNIDDIFYIFISECEPKYGNGVPINIKAQGSIPMIDFDDYDSIFREQQRIQSSSEYVKPKEIKDHTAFIINDKTILFNNVCINTTAKTKVYLRNNGLVPGFVCARTNSSHFQVTPELKEILPYSDASFTVSFTPTMMDSYSANLDFQIQLPNSVEPSGATYKLKGEGTVPEIKILEPVIRENSYRIVFNPTLANKTVQKRISFINVGDFPCKTILEIRENDFGCFTFGLDDVTPFLNQYASLESMQHQAAITLLPGQIANVYLKYSPNAPRQDFCLVRLHVVYNPFEIYTIQVKADCFTEDIIIDDLPTCMQEIIESAPASFAQSFIHSKTPLVELYCTNYILDFGYCFLNVLQKLRFKIINQSEKDIYKFEFKSVPEVIFTPCVGHLKPGAKKEVITTFLSPEPIFYKDVPIQCLLSKIEYISTDQWTASYLLLTDNISWDDRQQLILFDERGTENISVASLSQISKISINSAVSNHGLVEMNTEPVHSVVPNSNRHIPFLLSAVADFSSYECNVSTISFGETFVFEKQTFPLTIVNNGNVDLEIEWTFEPQAFSEETGGRRSSVRQSQGSFTRPSTSMPQLNPNLIKKHRPLTGNIPEHLLYQEPQPPTSKKPTPVDPEIIPFSIWPLSLKIPPKEKGDFTVIFAPPHNSVHLAVLKGKISNVSPTKRNLVIHVRGISVMPYCHFDLQFSDYLTRGKRLAKECDSSFDANIKVVEFDCLGTGIVHKKSFNVVNPKEEPISFVFTQIRSHETKSVPLFQCLNCAGKISPGRQYEVTFQILPPESGTYESLYLFKIEKYNYKLEFLIVANVREADVYFLNSHIEMKPTVMGITVYEMTTLKNEEDEEIMFKFKKSSIYSEGRRQCLTIEPKKGILPRKGEAKIKIGYYPSEIGEAFFKLKCTANYLSTPLTLDVVTTCFEVQPMVFYSLYSDTRSELNVQTDNCIDLGAMNIGQTETIKISIVNVGKVGFYYQWNYNDDMIDRIFHIEITGKEGYVKTDTEISCNIAILPLKNGALKNFKMTLKIRYGPTYKILIHGTASKNIFKFSFLTYNFGYCFRQSGLSSHYHKALEFTNCGNKNMILDCNFTNTDFLTVQYRIKDIQPKSREFIHFYFHPQKVMKYFSEVIFFVNSQPIKIKILGEGIKLNVVLENIKDKIIDLGNPLVGQRVCKTVRVVNKSPATVEAIFDIWDRLPFYLYPATPVSHYLDPPLKPPGSPKTDRKGKKGKKDKKGKGKKGKDDKKSKSSKKTKSSKTSKSSKSSKGSKDKKGKKGKKGKSKVVEEIPTTPPESPEEIQKRMLKLMISISPREPVIIPPYKTKEFTITFYPRERIKPFTEKISMQVNELIQPLCLIKGSSIGMDVFLDRTLVAFGPVILNCVRETKLMLINSGDIGAKFRWVHEHTPDFSIFPKEGYSNAGAGVTFSVKFHPSKLEYEFRLNMNCFVDGYDVPLTVSLVGNCTDIPPPLNTLKFECPVRSTAIQKVFIKNDTGQEWKIIPLITGDYYSTSSLEKIAAQSQKECDIIYRPLKMTGPEQEHKGFVFYKLPSGSGIVYDFIGRALLPQPEAKLTLEVHCKQHHTQPLNIKNWLNIPQKLWVKTEDITAGRAIIFYKVSGQDFIDIPKDGSREYLWQIFTYKECSLDFKVIFTNEEQEYLFYLINVKVLKPCSPIETIELSSCVRCPVEHYLTIENPLDKDAMFIVTSESIELISDGTISVPAHSEAKLRVEYKPFFEGKKTVTLDVFNNELGNYPYEFVLKALPVNPEPTLHVSCVLGETKELNVPIKNLSVVKTTYVGDFIHGEEEDPSEIGFFFITGSQSIQPGQEGNLTVLFDPHSLEDVKISLKAVSQNAGDFVFPIVGKCLPPKPKGPFNVYLKDDLSLKFRNPFLTDEDFEINIDPPDTFEAKTTEMHLESKKTGTILVSLMERMGDDRDRGSYISGKLIVNAVHPDLAHFKWNYYLQYIPNVKKSIKGA